MVCNRHIFVSHIFVYTFNGDDKKMDDKKILIVGICPKSEEQIRGSALPSVGLNMPSRSEAPPRWKFSLLVQAE